MIIHFFQLGGLLLKMNIENRPKTIFCDIDGTLIIQDNNYGKAPLLPNVASALKNWSDKGYILVLTTARDPMFEKETRDQLNLLGIKYDKLIMGISAGVRVLINDKSFSGERKAFAFNLDRDRGFDEDLINL